jgi:hypothetical protein
MEDVVCVINYQLWFITHGLSFKPHFKWQFDILQVCNGWGFIVKIN